ncbi:MAG: Asp23/Gls24 family envelope stress response protein [Ruminococcaceae bacterium]|nr:Asp23/Gls24 family envelope stress response protein [Oscillospiraceae bacterium]
MDRKVSNSTGELRVSNDVIVRIAELAATEISGVAVENGKLMVPQSKKGIASIFTSPVQVSLSKEAAAITVSIITLQGSKAVNVASAVQDSVKSAVQNMTGIPVSKVNVNIVGIQLNK